MLKKRGKIKAATTVLSTANLMQTHHRVSEH